MNLKNTGYSELAKNIIKNNSRIIIYGAGMIGQIVVPYIVETYHLHSYIDYYVDMDDRKIGKQVSIGFSSYDIRSPEILDQISGNTVILLTNSKFYPVIEFLDTIEALKNVDCYIVPMMQKIEQRTMIPKIIHYCWFGRKEMPDLLK